MARRHGHRDTFDVWSRCLGSCRPTRRDKTRRAFLDLLEEWSGWERGDVQSAACSRGVHLEGRGRPSMWPSFRLPCLWPFGSSCPVLLHWFMNLEDGRQDLILQWKPWRTHLYVVAWDLFSGWTRKIGLRSAKVHSWTWAASHSWNVRFNETVKSSRFSQLGDVLCVYMILHKGLVVFAHPLFDNILIIGNDVGWLSEM